MTKNVQTTVKEVRILNNKSSFAPKKVLVIYQRADLRCNDDYDYDGVGNDDEDNVGKASW